MKDMNIQEVSSAKEYQFEFSFCTLVTRIDEYKEMVASAIAAGFDEKTCEFLYLDNSQNNEFDGYSGLNHFFKKSRGRYLIYCHQDVLYQYDGKAELLSRIDELSAIDPNWAVLGNAGKTHSSRAVIRITDPHNPDLSQGNFPEKVMSLDENFMLIDREKCIASTGALHGFHLYAVDLCQNAEMLGYSNYVVDFHLYHKSPGNVDASYHAAQERFIKEHRKRKSAQIIDAMCSRFFISASPFKMWLFNQKSVLNLLKSLNKRFG